MAGRTLRDAAEVIRSKNAGPCVLSLDIIFSEAEEYRKLKQEDFFSRERIARLYGIPEKKILDIIYFDPADAVKITMVRPCVCGDPGETDVYGAQQHGPLLTLGIPERE